MRIRMLTSFVFCLLPFVFVSAVLCSQDRRVIVVNPRDADLKREAARLRMCPDDLRNIRQVLSEMAERLPEAVEAGARSGVGHYLFRFNRAAAEETALELLRELAERAANSDDPQGYARLTSAARDLLSAMDWTNPALAAKLEEEWPEGPPEGLPGVPAGAFSTQQYLRSARRNPEQVLEQLASVTPQNQLAARSLLLDALIEKGMEPQARQLVEETLSAAPMITQSHVHQYVNFVRTAALHFPDYSEQIYSSYAALYQRLLQWGGSERQFRFPNGQTMNVSLADHFLANGAVFMNFDPQLALKIAELSPVIRQKMNSEGGYRALFFHRNRPAERQKLLEIDDNELQSSITDGKSAIELLQVYYPLCQNFPEKAERFYELALKAAMEEALPQALQNFAVLSSNCAQCLGLLPEKWFVEGRHLLAKARMNERDEKPASAPGGYGSVPRSPTFQSAHHLEMLLIAFRAQTDFSAAMQEVQAIDDKIRRFDALTWIIQRLGNR
jgi:hypothetical protein